MNNRCATINKILPFSCVDGPGNRLVLFLQGCNFHCQNCHNPYTIGLCDDCGDCVVTCPHNALSLSDGKILWAKDHCQQCDTCLQTCSKNASPMTFNYGIDDILSIVRRHAAFLTGITVSGGEATLQLPFITELFSAIKQSDDLCHLTCFIDSNGYLTETGWHKVLPYTDGTMIDLKAWHSQRALTLTGRDNQRVIASIRLLAQAGKLYEIRLLYIPEQTDFLEYIDELSTFLISLPDSIRIKINAFQTHGVTGEAANWRAAKRNDIDDFALLLRERGIRNLHLPSVYL